jgi:hypothetical protein
MKKFALSGTIFLAALFVTFCGEGKKPGDNLVKPPTDSGSPTVTPQKGNTPALVPVWEALTTVGAPDYRKWHTAVWAGSRMIIFGGFYQYPDPQPDSARKLYATGGIFERGKWQAIPSLEEEEKRFGHTAVFGANQMIVWGGSDGGKALSSGWRFDSATDTWSSTAKDTNTPGPRYDHQAVWTGDRMFVWGGINTHMHPQTLSTGGLYDPSNNVWETVVSDGNSPSNRYGHSATFLGTRHKIAVWGGYRSLYLNDGVLNDGSIYDLNTKTWSPMKNLGVVPSARADHSATWVKNKLFVWGGRNVKGALEDGGLYDPDTGVWTSVSMGPGVPSPRFVHSAVSTGEKVVIWGGQASDGLPLETGAIYDPATNTWEKLPSEGAPAGRYFHTAVWAKDEMIIFGGQGKQFELAPNLKIVERKDGAILKWVKSP